MVPGTKHTAVNGHGRHGSFLMFLWAQVHTLRVVELNAFPIAQQAHETVKGHEF